jgi:hypothetical protein
MPAAPLTHHEIMALMAPFSASGFRLDLAASDRSERRLVLRRATPSDSGAAPTETAPQQHLELTCPPSGRLRLVRVLTPGSGPAARLHAAGTDAAALLARLQAVPAPRPFAAGAGWRAALELEVTPDGRLDPLQGVAEIDGPAGAATQGLTLTLRLPGTPRRGCDLLLHPRTEPRPALPEDALAVLGWHWARLLPQREGWKTRLRLPWRRALRPAAAEAALHRAAAHLAATLAAPPAAYHRHHRLARWGVFLRRGIPTFNALGLIAVALGVAQLDLDVDRAPGLWVALYHVPTLLVALSFYAQELARFEFPPVPRALAGEAWGGAVQGAHPAPAAGQAGVPA